MATNVYSNLSNTIGSESTQECKLVIVADHFW